MGDPLELPGLRQLANWGYDLFARRREKISVGLGLAACAAPASPAAATKVVPPPALSPFRHQLRFGVSMLREAAVLAMLITLVSETLFINAAVPPFLKHEQPLWIKRLVAYPRLIQAWSMFASDAPRGDETVVVDAVTVDGRHVDPYSEATSRYPNPGRFEIPPRLDNDSLVFNYSGRIADQGAYHNAFKDWVLRYHERTGNPQDRIVKFDAYYVEDDSPPPGETNARNVRSRLFLSYPRYEDGSEDRPGGYFTTAQKPVVSMFTPPRQISNPAKTLVRYQLLWMVLGRLVTASLMKRFRS